jgi:hypothetical protein
MMRALRMADEGLRANGRWKRNSTGRSHIHGTVNTDDWSNRMSQAGVVLDHLGEAVALDEITVRRALAAPNGAPELEEGTSDQEEEDDGASNDASDLADDEGEDEDEDEDEDKYASNDDAETDIVPCRPRPHSPIGEPLG